MIGSMGGDGRGTAVGPYDPRWTCVCQYPPCRLQDLLGRHGFRQEDKRARIGLTRELGVDAL
jgi:hypothetical protein